MSIFKARKHPVLDQIQPSSIIFLHPGTVTSALSVILFGCKKIQMTA